MKFRKFNSIENTYRSGYIDRIRFKGLSGGEWVAREKIHGANFSFHCDGGEVRTAGRNNFVDGTFFTSYHLDKYKPIIQELYTTLVMDGYLKPGDILRIYGEIFGGDFFGKTTKDHKKIQGGMNYHPEVEFCAFMTIIEMDEGEHVLSDSELESIVGAAGIPLAPVLARGSFEDLLVLDNDFPSLVPAAFGLEVPEGERAQCEGFVLSPAVPVIFNDGGMLLLKSKNEKFSEKKKTSSPKPPIELSEEDQAKADAVMALINTARLESVASKEGGVSWEAFGKIAGLLVQDAVEEYEKDEDLKSTDLWKAIKKSIMREAQEVTRQYIKENS